MSKFVGEFGPNKHKKQYEKETASQKYKSNSQILYRYNLKAYVLYMVLLL